MARRLSAWAVIGWTIALTAVVVPVVIVTRTRDVQDHSPVLDGRLWQLPLDGGTVVIYVTREERSRSVPMITETTGRFEPYARFRLVARRIPDGVVVSTADLGDVEGAGDATAPRIIGVASDVVWVWRNGLEGRRFPGLGVYITPATLTRSPLASAAELPVEPDGFAVRPNPPLLVARGRDARFYAVDAVTRSMEPFDPTTLPSASPSTSVEDRFDALVPPGRSVALTSVSTVLQRSFLTRTNQWYSLMSESERARPSRWPSGAQPPYGEVARSLYRTTYKLDDRNVPDVDTASLTPVGRERLIQAGFLIRREGAIWDVSDPSSSLVMAKRLLGSREPWEVVRLARDGTVLWRTSTELAEPTQVLDLGSHVAFFGEEIGTPGGRDAMRQRLVWIDERTGARRALRIATGEVR